MKTPYKEVKTVTRVKLLTTWNQFAYCKIKFPLIKLFKFFWPKTYSNTVIIEVSHVGIEEPGNVETTKNDGRGEEGDEEAMEGWD